jgi:phosphate starvation-inducible membrane PsiE
VAITAMTRYMTVDIKTLPAMSLFVVTGAILVLSLAVLVLQVAASKAKAEGDAGRKEWA